MFKTDASVLNYNNFSPDYHVTLLLSIIMITVGKFVGLGTPWKFFLCDNS